MSVDGAITSLVISKYAHSRYEENIMPRRKFIQKNMRIVLSRKHNVMKKMYAKKIYARKLSRNNELIELENVQSSSFIQALL